MDGGPEHPLHVLPPPHLLWPLSWGLTHLQTKNQKVTCLLALKFDLLPRATGLLCLLPCCLGLCATTLFYPCAAPTLPLCYLGATPLRYPSVATPVLPPLCYVLELPPCATSLCYSCAAPEPFHNTLYSKALPLSQLYVTVHILLLCLCVCTCTCSDPHLHLGYIWTTPLLPSGRLPPLC